MTPQGTTIESRTVRLNDGRQAQIMLQQADAMPAWILVVFPDRRARRNALAPIEAATLAVEAAQRFLAELTRK